MNTIHLHGALKPFGGPFTLDVRTPAEAVRALCNMRPGFEAALRRGAYRVIRGKRRAGQHLDKDELHINLNGELHLVPVTRGAKNGGGTTKIVIGVVLIAAAAVLTFGVGAAGVGAALGASTTATAGGLSTAAIVGGAIINTTFALGFSMLLTGISTLISPQPKSRTNEEQQQSYLFGGAQNTTDQGVPIPIVIGQIRTGSVVISASLEADAVVPSGGQYVVGSGSLSSLLMA